MVKKQALHQNFGKVKIGLINKTHMAGYNGIVSFIQVEEQKMIKDKLKDGHNQQVLMVDLENGW